MPVASADHVTRTPSSAARSSSTVLHYTIGFTIEKQARGGEAYETDNPYASEQVAAQQRDAERFPLATQALSDLFDPDTDAGFEHGLQIILTGIRVTQFGA